MDFREARKTTKTNWISFLKALLVNRNWILSEYRTHVITMSSNVLEERSWSCSGNIRNHSLVQLEKIRSEKKTPWFVITQQASRWRHCRYSCTVVQGTTNTSIDVGTRAVASDRGPNLISTAALVCPCHTTDIAREYKPAISIDCYDFRTVVPESSLMNK